MRTRSPGRRNNHAPMGPTLKGPIVTNKTQTSNRYAGGILAALCATAGILALLTATASATITHNLISRITEVPASTGATVTGPLVEPRGLATDSGNLYLADDFTATVDEFDSSGSLISQIPEIGASDRVDSLAVDHASGDVLVTDSERSHVRVFGSTGALLHDWTGEDTPAGSFGRPSAVGVDNSTSLSDPAAGDVYVVDASNVVVDVFKPEAGGNEQYITQITGTPSGAFVLPTGVAVSAANGDVYLVDEVSSQHAVVDIFKPVGLNQYEYLTQLTGPGNGEFAEIGGVAIDPVDGHVYVSDNTVRAVDEFSSTGDYLGRLVGSPEAPFTETKSVAVGAGGDLYVAEGNGGAVDVFGPSVVIPDVLTTQATSMGTTTATLNGSVNPDGTSVVDCKFEYGSEDGVYDHSVPCSQSLPLSGESPVAVSAEVTGLTIATAYHYRVVASNANGTSTAIPLEFETSSIAPGVEGESVEKIGTTVATLAARINQNKAATTYHFEFGPTGSYGTSVPVPDRAIGSGPNETTVSQVITGLTAGASYHYRVVATNADGSTNGPDRAFATFASSSSGVSENCPNAALREAQGSTSLPDCRAYEQVSPVSKNGGDVFGQSDTSIASSTGDAIAYLSYTGFSNTAGSGALGAVQYVAFRGADAWSTYAVTPTPATSAYQIFAGDTFNRLFSDDFAGSVVEGYVLPDAEAGVPTAENLYLEDVKSQDLQTISKPQEGTQSNNFRALETSLRGASSDLGVVVFETPANLLTQATGSGPKLYVSDHGSLQLVGVLPDGSLPSGGSASARESLREATKYHDAVSVDGSRIFFMSPADGSSAPQLYMRENEQRSVWVSQSEASAPDPEPQNVKFQGATPDGSQVLFTTTDRLLDVDPGGPGYGLYRYSNTPNPESEANLTFIGRFTDDTGGNGPPEVVGMSTDAKRIYVRTMEESFDPIRGASFALDVWDEGVTRVAAHLSRGGSGEAVVSADGQRIAFLTGEPSPGRGEMYLYDAPSEKLTCVSCLPNNAGGMLGVDSSPAATEFAHTLGLGFPHRLMSSDGRFVFFATPDALLPQDTNGVADVYEYSVETGELSLISISSGSEGTWFVEASASGRDVFVVTRHAYSRSDTDSQVDLYDIRVDGGLAEPPAAAVACAGDACQGLPSAAPTFNTASGFEGLGNIVSKPLAKPSTKKKVAKKKKSKPKKHAVKKHRKRSAAKKSGHSGRRASHRSRR